MVKRYDQYHHRDGIDEMENGDYVLHSDYAALAERCERLEGALKSLRSMCADNLELGAEGPGYWEDCGDVINEALDDAKDKSP